MCCRHMVLHQMGDELDGPSPIYPCDGEAATGDSFGGLEGDELTIAHPRDIGGVAATIPTPRRYQKGASTGTWSMLGDSPSHVSARPPDRVAPVRDAAQETADEEQLQLARPLELRLAPEQLAALVEIHRAVAGHLDRKALFAGIAQALQGVVPVSRSLLLLPGNDPAALTIYASYGKLGLEFYQGQTIARAGSIPGWVVGHGRPFVLDRAEHIRERFPVSYQRLRQWGMESVAVVPLLTEGRCVGALSLMSEQADAWSGVSSVLLEEIAASMAWALVSCMAYEEDGRLRDAQTGLLEIKRAVARHLHRDELFAALADCLRDLLPSDRFGIEFPVANGKLRAHVLSSRNAKTAPAQIDELPSAGPPAARRGE